MKKFLTIVGLLTVVATPAFVQLFESDNEPASEQAERSDATSECAHTWDLANYY